MKLTDFKLRWLNTNSLFIVCHNCKKDNEVFKEGFKFAIKYQKDFHYITDFPRGSAKAHWNNACELYGKEIIKKLTN